MPTTLSADVEGSAIPVPVTDFAKKYAEKSRHALAGALGEIRSRRLEMQKEITEQRFANGEFVKVYTGPGKQIDMVGIATVAADGETNRGDAPRSFHARGGRIPGVIELTGIPWGQYPEFDALQAEEIWLSRRVEDLQFTKH